MFESSELLRFNTLVGELPMIGVSALMKSVYAVGGVIGVFRSCSCLMTADMTADIGVDTISEGKDADLGVCKGGRTGLVMAVSEGMLDTGGFWSCNKSSGRCRGSKVGLQSVGPLVGQL